MPVIINSFVATPSSESLVNKKDGLVKRRKTPSARHGKGAPSMGNLKKSTEDLCHHQQRLLPRRQSSAKLKRGFKTEARHMFLRQHQESIPNLNDAVETGKKHTFFGWNVHFFRG